MTKRASPTKKKPTAPRYVWSRAVPTTIGRWFFRESPDDTERIVRVFRSKGDLEFSYRYGRSPDDVDYCCNAHEAWWAGPVLVPVEPPDSDDTISSS